ncbi:MAG: Xaa-Pro aminopeptidase [Acidiferrobacteraceae bacterium]|jgi:Xaa-Pro aminopeptidase|nr:Xaa-Pro aminopeptidase [Acidiferrobacteraceae bacterium]MDP6399095.1 aminopeptidase P N-terminal domain-containing protein [Arenicellales bacterium]MDP6530383.1 aminopeptidase P N-terminal domain-containing protein [Arenicellales bacterium]MDP6919851.1 aminopeptidase P N-terminal domain-containing protein [Arenicellales bacterium]
MTTVRDYARRRQNLMQHIGDGIAILPSAPVARRNGDVLYRYRPDSDFFYLTGFSEPEAVAVLIPGRAKGEFLIFCRQRNSAEEMWDGHRAGLEGAVKGFNADDAFPMDDIEDILPGLLENRSKVYCNLGRYPDFDEQLLHWLSDVKKRKQSGISAPGELVDLGYILHELRLVKGASEIRAMKKAAAVSVAAHRRAMSRCRPGMFEYEIEAELEYAFRQGGAQYPAYPSIVAGGKNACILHYINNNQRLRRHDLLLIDAGAEIDCYCADITRTFPVSGRFSGRQKALYEIVLAAQLAAIDSVSPGASFIDPHETAVRTITIGLKDLKLLKGSVDSLVEKAAYRKFFTHRTSHWLGLDVHDVGEYRVGEAWRVLEPGMVLTIEPGIYVPQHRSIPEKWHEIGIRIEDDVLVTRQGHEVLTGEAPKDPAAIEALMASGN